MAVALALVAIVIATASWLGYRQLWDRQDLERFAASMDRVERILDRMELATFVVAADLSVATTKVETVAEDLAQSQQRADTVVHGQPGEAADAGAQSGLTSDTAIV